MKMHSYESLLFKRRRLQYKARMRYLKDLDHKGDVGEKNLPKKNLDDFCCRNGVVICYSAN